MGKTIYISKGIRDKIIEAVVEEKFGDRKTRNTRLEHDLAERIRVHVTRNHTVAFNSLPEHFFPETGSIKFYMEVKPGEIYPFQLNLAQPMRIPFSLYQEDLQYKYVASEFVKEVFTIWYSEFRILSAEIEEVRRVLAKEMRNVKTVRQLIEKQPDLASIIEKAIS